jgi:hypothetical protein
MRCHLKGTIARNLELSDCGISCQISRDRARKQTNSLIVDSALQKLSLPYSILHYLPKTAGPGGGGGRIGG